MNLPNRISLCRLVLTFLMVALFLAEPALPYGTLYATGVYIVAAFTDFLDGYIARKRRLVTTLGKFLDSISDKILCLAAFILVAVAVPQGASMLRLAVIVLVVVHIARDFAISALRQVCASRNVIMAADKLGKVKAVFDYVSVPLMMCAPAIASLCGFNVLYLYAPGFALFAVATVMSIVAAAHYLVVHRDVLRDGSGDAPSAADAVPSDGADRSAESAPDSAGEDR